MNPEHDGADRDPFEETLGEIKLEPVRFGEMDLSLCAREPIHAPGSVQPHGCLVILDADTWTVRHATTNLHEFFDKEAVVAIGQDAARLFGTDGAHLLRNLLQQASGSTVGERFLDRTARGWPGPRHIFAHLSGDSIAFEFERADDPAPQIDPLILVKTMVDRLSQTDDFSEFFTLAARQLRAVLGYDRALVYRFADDYSGEVVGEATRSGMESMMGLHFPESDIPAQARALYLKNPIRVIADVHAKQAALMPSVDAAMEGVDLGNIGLRSVSPVHLEYLRNMQVGASMSISIIVDGRLWGMFACHHRAPRIPHPGLRSAAELFSRFVSLSVTKMERERGLISEREGRAAMSVIAEMATGEEGVFDNLSAFSGDIMRAIPCDGIVTISEHGEDSVGLVPSAAVLGALRTMIAARPANEVIATDCLRDLLGVDDDQGIAGVVALTVPRAEREHILLFRKEIPRRVSWAGDPRKPGISGNDLKVRIHPRKSFSAWVQTVRGRATPWSAREMAVVQDLRHLLVETALRRTDAAERLRRDAAERQDVLLRELDHRVRNVLSLTRSMVRGAASVHPGCEEFAEELVGRVEALAASHELTAGGLRDAAPLSALLDVVIAPFRSASDAQVTVDIPQVRLAPRACAALSLVMHELCTNAAKYGALSAPGGRLLLTAKQEPSRDRALVLRWTERGGPKVSEPTTRGFGSTLIERLLPHDIGGSVELRFAEEGLEAVFSIPAELILPGDPLAETVTEARDPDHIPPFRALAVEDSSLIALDLESMLHKIGARDVQIAATLRDARAAVAEGELDIAILDLNLGSSSALPLADELLERGVPVVFVSGYSAHLGGSLPDRLAQVPFVAKPFTSESLRKALARAFNT